MPKVDLIKDHPKLIRLTEEFLTLYSRNSYERLMRDWITIKQKNIDIKVSALEKRILDCLYYLDFLTSEQLKALFFSTYSYTGAIRCLNKLAKRDMIFKEHYSETRDKHWVLWRLTECGMGHQLESMGRESSDRDRKEIKVPQLNHDTSVNQVYIDICKSRSGVEAMLEEVNWHPYPDRHLKYSPKEKYDSKRNRSYTYYSFVHPDAVFESRLSKIRVYLEIDMGTEGLADILKNLKAYAQYFKESQEQCSQCVFLVFSVPDENRKKTILKAFDEAGGRSIFANFRCRIYGPELVEKLSEIIVGRSDGKGS